MVMYSGLMVIYKNLTIMMTWRVPEEENLLVYREFLTRMVYLKHNIW